MLIAQTYSKLIPVRVLRAQPGICAKIPQIAEEFMADHSVEIWSKGVFPNWNSIWVIDGRFMRTEGVK
jgi:hypothetical protein